MNLFEYRGDLFQIDRGKWVLAHCISEDVTATKAMNKGIAKIFRNEYPTMASIIITQLKVGRAIRFEEKGHIIYNLISKHHYWQKAKGQYEEQYYFQLSGCLNDMKNQMVKNNELCLAMPRIASGLDGGDWTKIKQMIESIFDNTDIEIQIRYL